MPGDENYKRLLDRAGIVRPVNLQGRPIGSPSARPDLVPRLPRAPAFVSQGPLHAPPTRQDPAPFQGTLPNVEASTVLVDYPTAGTEVSVWKSERSWNSCDVYIQLLTPINASITGYATIWVRVYAISDAGRAQVASGFVQVDGTAGATGLDIQNPWIVAARAAVVRFEVTVTMLWSAVLGTPPPPGNMAITASAADDLPEAPDYVGTVSPGFFGNSSDVLDVAAVMSGSTVLVLPQVELVRVQGIHIGVGPLPLWLNLYDLPSGAAFPIGGPILQWPMGLAAGGGVDEAISLRMIYNPVLAVSSTPNVYTADVNGFARALVR